MTSARREAMLKELGSPTGFEDLRNLVQGYLDEGAPSDELLDDLSGIRELVSDDDEETVLDVMDLLVGWCAPQFRLTGKDNPTGKSGG